MSHGWDVTECECRYRRAHLLAHIARERALARLPRATARARLAVALIALAARLAPARGEAGQPCARPRVAG